MVITTAKKKAMELNVFSCNVEYHYLVNSKDLMTDLDYQILIVYVDQNKSKTAIRCFSLLQSLSCMCNRI